MNLYRRIVRSWRRARKTGAPICTRCWCRHRGRCP